ncbi:RING-H2 finger protein ATL72 [Heracleum sosnowskyi]|uniref:RING-type E3 ubiquitin transferase n=1 Tax=Heracleum sosnowskyi TaxID=360622 RepID=A0AAD8GWK4_9APIA|nr:RING-H2 finger protein ATL72 [Heracleum sosnowskyi]
MVHLRRLLVDVEPSMPPASVSILPKHYINETKFDTNMVIILAALLCALLCALGLNSIIRCLLRCTHRFGTETQQQAAARLATTGVKRHTLRNIPIAIYGSEVKFSTSECPICLAEFVEGEKVRVLPKCSHGFHVKCIDTWLESHSSCPNCRRSLLERSTSRVADESCVTQPQESNSSGQQQPSTVTVVVAQV